MSGGEWNYRDTMITDSISPHNLVKILDAVRDCFHQVDYALCGDYSRGDAEHALFEIIRKLGHEMFK